MENYKNEAYGVAANSAVSGDEMNSEPLVETSSITSFNTLKAYARGRVVHLPDFAEDMPFVARVRRPSLLALAKFGRIPNDLLKTAGSLFVSDGNALDSDDPDMLGKISSLLTEVAKASLIEPTLEDINNAGLELTDEQLMAIFNYSQSGIEALKPFREQ